ncbi:MULTISPECIES: hypothetical protein [Mycoplasma]|uniref:hypothetical protein n=1 Tax=Mycoplasma TaxID=2093 RepID=UPI001C101654|nr:MULTISPECIES: hypothetical protein [Mycoplasma]MBU4690054.1 hypothetical protein [Mycoplasma zalophidermidis]MCS4536797.1 hypothetical protein [Mycoplasma sp. CSL7475-4]MCT4469967.1 hypothetical protein [Mycoplasma sp. HS2188]
MINKILADSTNSSSSSLPTEISKSVTGGFQTILAAITVPAILVSSGLLIYLCIMLAKRFLQLSKVKVDEYKMEIKKLWWYIAGVIILFLAIVFLITMSATNWSILNPRG